MASLKSVLYLGVCVSAWIMTAADESAVPKAENVYWKSQDFKTILAWTAPKSNYPYTALFSMDDADWKESPTCIRVSETECDLTNDLKPFDSKYTAYVKTEPLTTDYDYDLDEYPHTYSPPFNPYRESNISAVQFTVESVNKSKVIVNITDPLTSIHQRGKQLSIRDILKNDLKYKVIYYKSGSTGKREILTDSSMAEVSMLDAGQSYCFMVAAFIPSRPKISQYGAWSLQTCTRGEEVSPGAWVGGVVIILTVLIVVITVTVLCCRCRRQRNQRRNTSQSQEDRSHSLDSVCKDKEEAGRARLPLISLAQTLVVNGKC